MNADRALERWGVSGEVEAVDVGLARAAVRGADLVLTNAGKAQDFDGLGTPVRVIDDFMDIDEIAAAIRETFDL